jgi:DNA-binding LytR/AlgR family response regulator
MKTITLTGLKQPVALASITHVIGSGNYSVLYTTTDKPKLLTITLKVIQSLAPDLQRIHKSHLVNPKFVQQYQRGYSNRGGYVVLLDGTILGVARRRQLLFREDKPLPKHDGDENPLRES